MSTELPDIRTEADIRVLVDSFYDLVLADEMLRPIFVDVARLNLEKHLPTMYAFWSSLLLGSASYRGRPFPVHARFQEHLTAGHFDRWLELFRQTLNEHFRGEVAETASQRAGNIAMVFRARMGLLP